ncbi:transcriptional regulator [Mycoplasmopsis pullorum]|uniref:helix-turn-helix transcriptional regulator n=1 Tax=Mycoplasmopsis pullorum TaxID=48003 RepID=UPI00111969FF|nr:helix-turn-helix transcriptional regulator [Mycoplasmopsis pullorum]TNK81784.1 transcriptional regulator [Mycoplasmopsis pullorum]TNK82401.1 transcriptional regulator [Mycoplasmopsis pullorum]TNK83898.1 transcriptional regulator [Mycoplasmopsis pullorum]TNK84088.1 transcriptional regulator [Mycoplasmopsis pullorum]TNK84660.1 transcriptional regulator [Mycoplasmopsis pullorum]
MKLEKFFKICSNETNIRLIIHLYSCDKNECNVQTFVELLNKKQANISKHFMELRRLKIVDYVRNGHEIFYKLNDNFRTKFNSYLSLIVQDHCYDKFTCACADLEIHTTKNDENCVHECCDDE